MYELSTINYQLSTINYQLSTINYQLSTINYQLSTINYQLSTINYPTGEPRMNLSAIIKSRTIALIALAMTVCFTAVSCAGGGSAPTATVGIAPGTVVDYIHEVAESNRTAYTKHVIGRLKTLEGNDKPKGVVNAEATEAWKQKNGIPLPAQMFRLSSELASESGDFTIGLISSWNINDNQAPKTEFEKTGMKQVEETGQPYKEEQEIAGKKYYSAIYPDVAVAEACVSCHNNHPIHKERYPDKEFKLGDVMGGVVINLPLD